MSFPSLCSPVLLLGCSFEDQLIISGDPHCVLAYPRSRGRYSGAGGIGIGSPVPDSFNRDLHGLILITCSMNLHLTGASIILVGTILNLIPLVLNGFVPVTVEAIVKAGIADSNSIDLVQLGAVRAFETAKKHLSFSVRLFQCVG